MRRLQGAIIALATTLLAGPAAAAEISRVASSGEPDSPFALELGVRWERTQERATIVREGRGDAPAGDANRAGVILDADKLRYTRTRNAIVPRLAVGLYRDLEFHAELPYVLEDDQSYRYASGWDAAGAPRPSIETNPYDPDGNTSLTGGSCAGTACPLFSVNPQTTVFHGGRAGDLKAGLAWAVFNDRKDDTKPTWVLGMDVTVPTSPAYEPAKGRTAAWASPYTSASSPGPFGERIWRWDLYTVMSRRLGVLDPYVKFHHTRMFKSSSTYTNCKYAKEMTDPSANPALAGQVHQMGSGAVAGCAAHGTEAGAQLPWVLGVVVGTEIVPYEDRVEGQRLSLDFRVSGDYTTRQRFFNELTDASGKIHQTGEYIELKGLGGLTLTASRYVQFAATAAISTRTAHYLTGEARGIDGSAGAVTNPNYDARYDAPGRRFKVTEVSVFELTVSGLLRF